MILIDTHAHYIREEGYPIGFSAGEAEQILADMDESWGKGVSAGLVPSKANDTLFVERIARAERLGTPPDLAAEATRLA